MLVYVEAIFDFIPAILSRFFWLRLLASVFYGGHVNRFKDESIAINRIEKEISSSLLKKMASCIRTVDTFQNLRDLGMHDDERDK